MRAIRIAFEERANATVIAKDFIIVKAWWRLQNGLLHGLTPLPMNILKSVFQKMIQI